MAKQAAAALITASHEAEALPVDRILINAFVSGVAETLRVQCAIEVKGGTPYTKTATNVVEGDIASLLGLLGRDLIGTVALIFKQDVFLKIMGKMLGEEYTTIKKEIEDGAAEMLNISFGQARKILTENGMNFGKSIPKTVIGSALHARELTPSPSVYVPINSSVGEFYLQIGTKKNNSQVATAPRRRGWGR
jgi:chemotaxis protein CheX